MKKEATRKLLGKRRNAARSLDRLFPLRGRQASRLAARDPEAVVVRDARKDLAATPPLVRIVIKVRPTGRNLADVFAPGVVGSGIASEGDSV